MAALFDLELHDISRHVIFAPSSTNICGSSGFAGIGGALADINSDDGRLGWGKVKL